jgi:hypothetical protein
MNYEEAVIKSKKSMLFLLAEEQKIIQEKKLCFELTFVKLLQLENC